VSSTSATQDALAVLVSGPCSFRGFARKTEFLGTRTLGHLVSCIGVTIPVYLDSKLFVISDTEGIHDGQECKLCLTIHSNEGNYLAHTQVTFMLISCNFSFVSVLLLLLCTPSLLPSHSSMLCLSFFLSCLLSLPPFLTHYLPPSLLTPFSFHPSIPSLFSSPYLQCQEHQTKVAALPVSPISPISPISPFSPILISLPPPSGLISHSLSLLPLPPRRASGTRPTSRAVPPRTRMTRACCPASPPPYRRVLALYPCVVSLRRFLASFPYRRVLASSPCVFCLAL
jgi:hypothetical protein